MENNKLRVAIIGCGNILPMHLMPILHSKNAELVAVCDIKIERAKVVAAKHKVKFYENYEDLILTEQLDAVHICTPHYLHPIISKFALTHNVNVLCEKPMSINYEDALANVQLAEKNNLTYGVIFQCRYNASSQLVKQTLDSGKLGKIISARSILTWYRPDDYYGLSDWKGTWDKEGGGVIIDQAIHSIDLVNWFINSKIVTLESNLSNKCHKNIEVEDTGEGYIRYENGTTYAFYAMNGYGCDEPIEIRLFCEKGKVVMGYDDATVTLNDGTVLKSQLQVGSDIDYEGGKDYWGFQHVKQIEQFYRAVKGLEPLQISGKEALKIQELVCKIYKNGRNK